MNADDKIVVFTAADVDALRNALAETSHVDSYLHEPVRALLARLDAISAASDAVVDAGPADMFSAEASEGHVVRCVIYGQDVGCKSVVVRGVYPVPEPVMVPWADARPGMVLVDRDADGEITGVALVGDDKVWRWVWTPYGIGRWGARKAAHAPADLAYVRRCIEQNMVTSWGRVDEIAERWGVPCPAGQSDTWWLRRLVAVLEPIVAGGKTP